jgi:exosome complex component RRP42
MAEIERVVSSLERSYIVKLLKNGERIDGRKLFEFRDIKIRTNYIPKAEGSAEVFLGDTRVCSGVKYEIESPFSDNPDEGVCTVSSEFLPMASPLFESGPPSEDSIQLARVIDRGIRHSNCVDFKTLCVEVGKNVYTLFVDCYIMDYYGNLIDATAIAAVSALISTKLPGAKVENGKVVWDGTIKPIKINEIPLSVSFGKIENIIFVDPSLAEELVLDGSMSFAVDESGNINSVQKFGEAVWTVDEIIECGKKAIQLAIELRQKLNLRQYTPAPQ